MSTLNNIAANADVQGEQSGYEGQWETQGEAKIVEVEDSEEEGMIQGAKRQKKDNSIPTFAIYEDKEPSSSRSQLTVNTRILSARTSNTTRINSEQIISDVVNSFAEKELCICLPRSAVGHVFIKNTIEIDAGVIVKFFLATSRCEQQQVVRKEVFLYRVDNLYEPAIGVLIDHTTEKKEFLAFKIGEISGSKCLHIVRSIPGWCNLQWPTFKEKVLELGAIVTERRATKNSSQQALACKGEDAKVDEETIAISSDEERVVINSRKEKLNCVIANLVGKSEFEYVKLPNDSCADVFLFTESDLGIPLKFFFHSSSPTHPTSFFRIHYPKDGILKVLVDGSDFTALEPSDKRTSSSLSKLRNLKKWVNLTPANLKNVCESMIEPIPLQELIKSKIKLQELLQGRVLIKNWPWVDTDVLSDLATLYKHSNEVATKIATMLYNLWSTEAESSWEIFPVVYNTSNPFHFKFMKGDYKIHLACTRLNEKNAHYMMSRSGKSKNQSLILFMLGNGQIVITTQADVQRRCSVTSTVSEKTIERSYQNQLVSFHKDTISAQLDCLVDVSPNISTERELMSLREYEKFEDYEKFEKYEFFTYNMLKLMVTIWLTREKCLADAYIPTNAGSIGVQLKTAAKFSWNVGKKYSGLLIICHSLIKDLFYITEGSQVETSGTLEISEGGKHSDDLLSIIELKTFLATMVEAMNSGSKNILYASGKIFDLSKLQLQSSEEWRTPHHPDGKKEMALRDSFLCRIEPAEEVTLLEVYPGMAWDYVFRYIDDNHLLRIQEKSASRNRQIYWRINFSRGCGRGKEKTPYLYSDFDLLVIHSNDKSGFWVIPPIVLQKRGFFVESAPLAVYVKEDDHWSSEYFHSWTNSKFDLCRVLKKFMDASLLTYATKDECKLLYP